MDSFMIKLVTGLLPYGPWRKRVRSQLLNRRISLKQASVIRQNYQQVRQNLILKQRNQIKLNVLFIVVFFNMWKLGDLYWRLKANPLFKPYIVVIPQNNPYSDEARQALAREIALFRQGGYDDVVSAFDAQSNSYIKPQNLFEADMVFFPSPYTLSLPGYNIDDFTNALVYYLPYGVMSMNRQQDQFNSNFHNKCWRIFYETPLHLQLAQKYSLIKGQNGVCVGYPLFDTLKAGPAHDPWKPQEQPKKRLIWAPHYTIRPGHKVLGYSCFFKMADLMLKLANQYAPQIQFAFKPHPVLRRRLSDRNEWGPTRTADYYNAWQKLPNGQVEEGSYSDLFGTSHAMILDSLSFISEYMVTGKPSLFTVRDQTISRKFNEFGLLNFNLIYKAHNLEKDIRNFIERVVLEENDPLLSSRLQHINKYFTAHDNQTACAKIYTSILNDLDMESEA